MASTPAEAALGPRLLAEALGTGLLVLTALWEGDAEWRDLPAYLAGPTLGGVLAAFAYDLVAGPRRSR